MASEDGGEARRWAARCLMRSARVGSLATLQDGRPFVSLVTPATAPDGSILLLLSDLAEHTHHLLADPGCALLLTGAPAEVNPQTTPRLTLSGTAAPDPDSALKARYMAIHPYAALYAGFTDFRIWRLRPGEGRLVEGFARASHLRGSDLAPAPASVTALMAAEDAIIAHCNADHPAALARIAGEPGTWRMVAVDADGCDLALGERVIRVAWTVPAVSAVDVRRELVRLAGTATQAGG